MAQANMLKMAALATVILLKTQACEAQDTALRLRASANHEDSAFKKFLFSFPLPEPGYLTGIRGHVSAITSRDSFGETLISYSLLPRGRCPVNGEVFNTYGDIRKEYPSITRFMGIILKKPTAGDVTLPLAFEFPGGVPASNCIVVTLDGSMLGGGDYTMSSDASVQFTTMPKLKVEIESFGDEFCFGTDRGCGAYHRNGLDQSYTTFFGFASEPTRVLAVQGNLSVSAFPSDLTGRWGYDVAEGEWSVLSELYVLENCANEDRQKSVSGFVVPERSHRINAMTVTISGVGAANKIIALNAPIDIPTGGCLAHFAKKVGLGGVNAELQITLFREKNY